MRRSFIDLGAHSGQVSFEFAMTNPGFDIYCVEPNPELVHHIVNAAARARRAFTIICAAAWTHDGTLEFFQSGALAASTVVPGKVERGQWPQIDYGSPTIVACFDFSAWLLRRFTPADHVIVKMDIEGAEYDLLDRMIDDRSLSLVRELRCEWHHDRFPAINQARHDDVRSRTAALTRLQDWG